MRHLTIVLLCALLAACHSQRVVLDRSGWQSYRTAFVSDEGRVIDNGNGGVSHSEGQGYGMLLAVAANDRQSFDTIWGWTEHHLAVRDDALFGWRWLPGEGNAVPDRNNATDGDLLIAWALARAEQRFREPRYGEAAKRIAATLRSRLLRNTRYGALLLPGSVGFESAEEMIVNPSYLIFPAFRELNRVDPSPQWRALEEGGKALLLATRERFGPLPPDWVAVNKRGVRAAGKMPLRFGYDALRVPLYCYWGGVDGLLDMPRIAAQWQRDDAPAWIALDSKEQSQERLSSAHLAVRPMVRAANGEGGWRGATPAALPSDYYGATMTLLVSLAWMERHE